MAYLQQGDNTAQNLNRIFPVPFIYPGFLGMPYLAGLLTWTLMLFTNENAVTQSHHAAGQSKPMVSHLCVLHV